MAGKYAKRRDANEPDIVAALLTAGCDVLRANDVDLIVGRAGLTYLIEVKATEYETREVRLKPIQRQLRDRWRGHYAIVTTAQQALAAVGL